MAKELIDTRRLMPSIRLTLAQVVEENTVDLVVSQLIAYAPKDGFTRLRLTGRKTIDVKETTDRIDYLIRVAAAAAL